MNTDPIQKTVSPVDGRVYVERRLATAEEINALREAEGEEVDRLFLRLMLYHHLGGIHMAEGVLKQSDHPDVTAAAELMLQNQQYEVEVLQELQRELDGAG